MIEVGIIGGAGYTAGELLRLLLRHPDANLNFVYSSTQAGQPVHSVHQDLVGETELSFTDKVNPKVEVVFLCLGHGNSKRFLKEHPFTDKTRIIDLSNDFRLDSCFVYGLPELRKEEITKTAKLANPGCFATAISLALLPLAAKRLIKKDVHINAVTGATGAGTSLSTTSHFSWRDNNFSSYKAFEHQHLPEIEASLRQLQPAIASELHFIPNRGNFSRGIHCTAYTEVEEDLDEIRDLYTDFYQDAVFTHVAGSEIHLKQVVNTNKCLLGLQKFGSRLLVTSVLDNLLKGASGQAVQNMNLMFGFPENSGLDLKASYF